ncbi:MAG: hypothetical protein R3C53_17675 [Pirellulaceae bacterium]
MTPALDQSGDFSFSLSIGLRSAAFSAMSGKKGHSLHLPFRMLFLPIPDQEHV